MFFARLMETPPYTVQWQYLSTKNLIVNLVSLTENQPHLQWNVSYSYLFFQTGNVTSTFSLISLLNWICCHCSENDNNQYTPIKSTALTPFSYLCSRKEKSGYDYYSWFSVGIFIFYLSFEFCGVVTWKVVALFRIFPNSVTELLPIYSVVLILGRRC